MKWRDLLFVLAGAFLGGCGNGSDELDTEGDVGTREGQLRFVNAIVDSPVVNFVFEGTNTGATVVDVPFGTASSLLTNAVGEFDVEAGYPGNEGERVILFEINELEVHEDDEKTIVLTGRVDAPSNFIIENEEFLFGIDLDEDGDQDPQFQVTNTSDAYELLDVYLTSSSRALSNATPLATLGYQQTSALLDVEAGDDYRLRVTPTGRSQDVLYDSGAFSLRLNSRTLVALYDFFGPGNATLRARPLTGIAGTFPEETLETELRVANGIADEPAIDVYFGDTAGTPEFASVPFAAFSAYAPTEPAGYDINITPEGVENRFIAQGRLDITGGASRTLFVLGLAEDPDASSTAPFSALALRDDERRPIATRARINVIHGAPGVGTLDIYLLAPGQAPSDVGPTFELGGLGGALSAELSPGFYDLLVEDRRNGTVLLGPERREFAFDRSHYLLFTDAEGGGAPLRLTQVSDSYE